MWRPVRETLGALNSCARSRSCKDSSSSSALTSTHSSSPYGKVAFKSGSCSPLALAPPWLSSSLHSRQTRRPRCYHDSAPRDCLSLQLSRIRQIFIVSRRYHYSAPTVHNPLISYGRYHYSALSTNTYLVALTPAVEVLLLIILLLLMEVIARLTVVTTFKSGQQGL